MFRTFLATITLAAPAITVAPLPSHAQSDYPNRIVKIVVPYPAGGVPDIAARALTTGLSGRLGQQFIVENKSRRQRRARHCLSGTRGSGRLYGAVRAGVGALGAATVAQRYGLQARLARPGLPDLRQHDGACSAAGFADQKHRRLGRNSEAKARRAELRPRGVMTIPHLAMEEFMQAAAIDIKDIPFRRRAADDRRAARRADRYPFARHRQRRSARTSGSSVCSARSA